MVFISLFLNLKSLSFFINLPLSKDTWLYQNLFFKLRVQINLNSVVSLPVFLAIFLLAVEIRIVEFILDLGVEFYGLFDIFGTKDPLWHF